MPRTGDIYTLDGGWPATPNFTIESADWNAFISDIALDLNAARPIVAGGTGAVSATAARVNLDTEVATQVVTNFDTHVFEAGSFHAAATATGGPIAGAFVGTALLHSTASDFLTITAYNMNASVDVPGKFYVREKKAGTWGSWIETGGSLAAADARYVNVTGDTMTGILNVDAAQAYLRVDGTSDCGIGFELNNVPRWTLGGADDMTLVRFDNAGVLAGTALAISRTNGDVVVGSTTASTSPWTGSLVVGGGVGLNGELHVNNVIRLRTSGTGAGIWYATPALTDQFFVGSDAVAVGDFRIYSVAASQNIFQWKLSTRKFEFSDKLSVIDTTASSSSTNGALVVGGGVGVGGEIHAGGNIETRASSPKLIIDSTGGAGPEILFYIGGTLQSRIFDNGASIFVYSNAAASTGMHIPHGTNAWSAVSDARLPYKRTAREITDRLPPLDHFHLYEAPNASGIPEVFAKAQEFDGLFPQLVQRGSDDPDYEPTGMGDRQAWGMSYDRMGAIALAYIKQLTARLDAIENRER